MSILSSQSIAPEFIKLRWLEPYTSSALNRKTFKSLPRGIYNGFVVEAGPTALGITVAHDSVSGYGLTNGYSYGAFDMASGWSIAVHASMSGYTSTVAIQSGPGQNFFFDLTPYAGTTVFPAIDVQYQEGYSTTGQVKIVQAADLEADPTLVVLARVNVPVSGTITQANIVTDDPAYPRILPFANIYKYGFMDKTHVEQLEFLQSVSASPAFTFHVILPVNGPQDVQLPAGYVYVPGSDDLWVFRNGVHMQPGAGNDYLEVDRGDGYGEKISLIGSGILANAKISMRIQKYSGIATSRMSVLDEGSLIETNTLEMNFEGPGVQVFPNGPRRVRVVIGGGGGGASAVKTKRNVSGAIIPIYRAVALLSDNTVALMDPANTAHKFYGVSLQAIPNVANGEVQVDGICANAAAGVSGSLIGADVYVSHLGNGIMTTSIPDPLVAPVIRVGFLDGAASVSGGVATDIIFDKGRLT